MEKYGRFAYVTNLEVDTQGVIMVELTEARLKDIQIVGNEKTKDFVIERELTFKPGDVVDLNEIDRSLRRVSCWASLMRSAGVFARRRPQ